MKTFSMTIDEYHEHEDSNNGFCTACGEVSDGFCEPDAENYKCGSCGKNAVQGLGNLLIMGLINLEV